MSNLGDTERSIELLDSAERVRETSRPDEIPGLFTFSRAKQTYYHGFTLMWGEKPKVLKQSVKAYEDAIAAWQQQRSPGDEMLSQIYLATANARLGDLDAGMAAVAPVLALSAHGAFFVGAKAPASTGLIARREFPGFEDGGERTYHASSLRSFRVVQSLSS